MSVSSQHEGVKTGPERGLASLLLPPPFPSHFSNQGQMACDHLDNRGDNGWRRLLPPCGLSSGSGRQWGTDGDLLGRGSRKSPLQLVRCTEGTLEWIPEAFGPSLAMRFIATVTC